MQKLLIFGLVGFLAQLVDGALGMAYGVTSASLLMAAGYSAVVASASVHLAEVGACLASGAAHWRFGNVSRRVVILMGIPGAVGAFAGAVFLTRLPAATAKPVVAGFLFCLGVYVLLRFTCRPMRKAAERHLPWFVLTPLGGFAGFMDAVGGGGWGPIGTPALMASGRLEPRKVVGSVDTAEFMVAVAASIGFFVSLSSESLQWQLVAPMLVGGLIAAPIAAWVVRILNPRLLGAVVGGLILLVNARTIIDATGVNSAGLFIYLSLSAVALGAVIYAWRSLLREGERVVAKPAAA